jgi:DNA-binding GntR family transcriptional regulator
MLQKTNRQTLVEQVALQIESMIESGKWGVGMAHCLPSRS